MAPVNNNVALNLAAMNGNVNNQPNDLSADQLGEIQMVQQRFMMMMFLYNQFMQANTPM